ncbi:MAG: CAP domain-containing protein, partial [Candidatus Vogelbacteria bacterium]|nr:CAP domain-containing protein [Candidatus Vogelbacteria bacterium]
MTIKQIKAMFFTGSAKAIFLISAIFVFELIFILPASTILQQNGFLSSVLPAVLVDYANGDRLSQNVIPLRINSLLSEAAQLKAEDMANRGYFSHDGPNGEKPWTWLDRVGYDYASAGENLAVDFLDSKEINEAWMNSPKHKENILKNLSNEINFNI